MKTNKPGIVITLLATVFSFFSILYISCSKTDSANGHVYCYNRVCSNGGYCADFIELNNPNIGDTLQAHGCVCPLGFEDSFCTTPIVSKYIGRWDMRQTIVHSSNTSMVGFDTTYVIRLDTTATPTTFFIDSFLSNRYYNNIICLVDTPTTTFTIQPTVLSITQSYPSLYGNGKINAAHDTITGTYYYMYYNALSMFEIDTISIKMNHY